MKRVCCRHAQAIGITSDPKTTFPFLLKICASTQRLCALLLFVAVGSRPLASRPSIDRQRRLQRGRTMFGRPSPPSAPRSNHRRARCTDGAPPPATSCLGASPTPTVGACGEPNISASEKPAQDRTHAAQQDAQTTCCVIVLTKRHSWGTRSKLMPLKLCA